MQACACPDRMSHTKTQGKSKFCARMLSMRKTSAPTCRAAHKCVLVMLRAQADTNPAQADQVLLTQTPTDQATSQPTRCTSCRRVHAETHTHTHAHTHTHTHAHSDARPRTKCARNTRTQKHRLSSTNECRHVQACACADRVSQTKAHGKSNFCVPTCSQ